MPKCSPSYPSSDCAGYANVVSKINAPLASNILEFIPLSLVDTSDWTIGRPSLTTIVDPSALVCRNAGRWNLCAQYQVGSFLGLTTPGRADVFGSLYRNGYELDQFAAVASVEGYSQSSVLVISYTANFCVGDYIQIGIFTQQAPVPGPGPAPTPVPIPIAGVVSLPYPSLPVPSPGPGPAPPVAVNLSGSSVPSLILTMSKVGPGPC
jgi:hypothetical protein